MEYKELKIMEFPHVEFYNSGIICNFANHHRKEFVKRKNLLTCSNETNYNAEKECYTFI